MLDFKTLNHESISRRRVPVNFEPTDSGLFEHELVRGIPASKLLRLHNIRVSPRGLLFDRTRVLAESFASPDLMRVWKRPKRRLRIITKHWLKRPEKIGQQVLWFTDNWSSNYFHWFTDALPRLFVAQDNLVNATILLPKHYESFEYIQSSLKLFPDLKVKFVKDDVLCATLLIPTHTAPTGNYNESIVKELRTLFTDFYQGPQEGSNTDKVYISRSKALKRRILNEDEVIDTLKGYGFKTYYFEDQSLEEQVKLATNTRYLIANHGAGLTNMLFMRTGSSVLELRRRGDRWNNCYFSLASALDLNYFYQLCDSEGDNKGGNGADLIVNCQSLRKNIEHMLQ